MKIQRVPDAENFGSSDPRKYERYGRVPDQSSTDEAQMWPGPLSVKLTPIESNTDSVADRARAVAQIIKRQQNGYYHSTEVLREIAARMLDSGDLVPSGEA